MKEKTDYLIMLIAAFARRHNLTQAEAYRYMSRFKGFDLCDRHYGIMHTLPLDDNLESIALFCRKNGGSL